MCVLSIKVHIRNKSGNLFNDPRIYSDPPYSPELIPCDLWLFPKLRDCRYETIEEMKEAVTKVIDTLN